MRNPEDNILKMLRKGDEAAFEVVFKSFYSKLYAFSKDYVTDSAIAENIVQDAFMVLWNKRAGLEEKTNLNAYLYTVVKNLSLNYLRHISVSTAYQKYEKSKKEELNLNIQALNDLETSKLAVKEIEQIIEETLDNLPLRCREVFEMSRFSGMKNREIADELGITEKAVEANVSRALKALKISLKDYLPVFFFLFN